MSSNRFSIFTQFHSDIHSLFIVRFLYCFVFIYLFFICVHYWECGGTHCLILQFLWVTSILLRRDIQLMAQVLQSMPVLLWRWESFEHTSLCTDEISRSESKGTCPLLQLLQRQSQDWNQGVLSPWQCPAVMYQWEMKVRGCKGGGG